MTFDIEPLVAGLQRGESSERVVAAQKLCQAGPLAQPAAVALVEATVDESDEVRQWATAALEDLGPPAASDQDKLADLLVRRQDDRAYWAATLLGRLGSSGAPALRFLEQVAGSAAPLNVRQQAVWAIGRLGSVACGAEATLRSLEQSPDPRLRRLAEEALAAIEKPPPNQR